jgi:uncharacterized protein
VLIILWIIGALVAYTIKGFSGFGPALVVVPLLSSLLDARVALSTSTVIDVVVGAILLARLGITRRELVSLRRNALALGIGTAIGAISVRFVPLSFILLLVATSVFVLSLRLLFTGGTSLAGRWWRPQPRLSFFVAGLSGGLVGVSGPYVVAGSVATHDKSALRRMLVAVFLLEGLVKVVIYAASDVLTAQSLRLSLVAVPAIAIGLYLGNMLHNRVSQTTFVRAVGLILLGLALQAFLSLSR